MRGIAGKKKIFFERIRFIYYPIVKYYLWRGYEVYAFDFTHNMKRYAWLRYLINSGKVKRIYVSPILKGHGDGIDQTEMIYQRLNKKGFEKNIARLYQSGEVELVFKKWLSREITKCLYIHDYLKEEETRSSGEVPVFFVPDYYLTYRSMILQFGDISPQALQKIKMPRWAFWVTPLFRLWDKCFYLFGGGLYLLMRILGMFLGRAINGPPPAPQLFTYAVAIHQEFDIKFPSKRRFDFLLDGEGITKENTLFLLYLSVDQDWALPYQEKGYHFLKLKELGRLRRFLQSSCPYGRLLMALRALLGASFCSNHLLPLLLAYLRCIRIYLNHQLVFSRASIKKYIYTNQESGNQLAINILIRGQGGETWNYAFSIGGAYLYAKNREGFFKKRSYNLAFWNSDHYVAVNEDMVQYHQMLLQKVRHYHVIGSIYSEMIQEIQSQLNRDKTAIEYFGKPWLPNQKIISFFDTSFVDSENCVTTFDHAIYFYQDIFRLLEEKKDIFIIIKPSKDESYYVDPKAQWSSPKKGKEIVKLWAVLKENPRIFWAGDRGDVPMIIAMSDLTVTHAFSSPTAEALAAGKKAIWYQSKGEQPFFYHDIPDLVVHGYEPLTRKMNYLLHEVDDQRYKEYLAKYIQGRLDPFLDGLGLTRFRQLLCA